MMVLIRLISLTKKDSVKTVKYNIFFYFYPSFKTFFHGSGSGFFRIGSGFLADPDPDSDKKV